MIEAGWPFYDPLFEDIKHITTSFSMKAAKPIRNQRTDRVKRKKIEKKLRMKERKKEKGTKRGHKKCNEEVRSCMNLMTAVTQDHPSFHNQIFFDT